MRNGGGARDDERRPGQITADDYGEREGYSVAPTPFVRRRNLSCGAKMTRILLQSYGWREGRCHPGTKELAADLCCSENTARAYIKELSDKGLVTVTRRGLGMHDDIELHAMTADDDDPPSRNDDESRAVDTASPDPQNLRFKTRKNRGSHRSSTSESNTSWSSSVTRGTEESAAVAETLHKISDSLGLGGDRDAIAVVSEALQTYASVRNEHALKAKECRAHYAQAWPRLSASARALKYSQFIGRFARLAAGDAATQGARASPNGVAAAETPYYVPTPEIVAEIEARSAAEAEAARKRKSGWKH